MNDLHTAIESHTFAEATSRVRVPQTDAAHPLLVMIHGFKGDENAPWIFSRAATSEWLIVSPRAPLTVPDGGYSWWQFTLDGKSDPDSIQAGINQLEKIISAIKTTYRVDERRVVLIGFSQGGAMALSYAVKYPTQVAGVASLSGFLPGPIGRGAISPLNNLPILITHGTQDETIAIALAHKAHDTIRGAGGNVTYAEDVAGHRVGTHGMRALTKFLAERLTPSHA